jgi:DnaJ-class molecular chaperone
LKTSFPKLAERKCSACDGTGFPAVKQPVDPSRKIYPARCETCDGKGRVTARAKPTTDKGVPGID